MKIQYDVLSKIFCHCVENDTKFFRSSIAYELNEKEDAIYYALKDLCEKRYIRRISNRDCELVVFSQLMLYIGRTLRRYYRIAPPSVKFELYECYKENGIEKDFMKFIMSSDFTPDEFSEFLGISNEEINYLLDYIDINLCRNAIKSGLKLPFSNFLSNE